MNITNKRAEQDYSAEMNVEGTGLGKPVRMVRESAVSLCDGFCYTGDNSYYTPINRLAKTLLIAIFFAMSISANLNAQTLITFTASSPPTLTQADVNSQVSGITSPFIAIIADNTTTISNGVFGGLPLVALMPLILLIIIFYLV